MTSQETRAAYKLRRHERLASDVRPKLDELMAQHGDRIVESVRSFRAQHGRGPTWGELCQQLHLSRVEVDLLIRELRRRGRVTFTQEKGSLRAEGKADGPYIERRDTHLPAHPEA